MLQYVCMLSHVQLFVTPMDCNPPGSSVHGIFLARILEWLPFPTPGDLPDPGVQSASLASWRVNSLQLPPGKPNAIMPLSKRYLTYKEMAVKLTANFSVVTWMAKRRRIIFSMCLKKITINCTHKVFFENNDKIKIP